MICEQCGKDKPDVTSRLEAYPKDVHNQGVWRRWRPLCSGCADGINPIKKPVVKPVRIFNSEDGREYTLYIRQDRLDRFFQFVTYHRDPEYKSSPMPGLNWSAILGLDAIFDHRPKKLPAGDMIRWLHKEISFLSIFNPPLTRDEVELALERFATIYPPDVVATNEED